MKDRLIRIDLEMTGLRAEQDLILEIASVVTDGALNIVAEGPDLVIHYPEERLAHMEAWSREHHTESGLLERVRNSPLSCAQAEEQTLAFLARHCRPDECPLAGNSVWQDRRFFYRHMPRLQEFCHYRIIDMSSIKELVRRWYPHLPGFEKQKAHLALNDIRESIQELRYYREHVFAPKAR